MTRQFRGGPGLGGAGRVVVISLVIAVVGAVAGAFVWDLLAPAVLAEATENGLRLSLAEMRKEFGIEFAFGVATAVVGLIAGAVLMLVHREQSVEAQIVAAVTGVLGAVGVWQVGRSLVGPDDVVAAGQAVPPGTMVPLALDISAYALLAVWPIAAVIGGALVVAVRDRPAAQGAPAS